MMIKRVPTNIKAGVMSLMMMAPGAASHAQTAVADTANVVAKEVRVKAPFWPVQEKVDTFKDCALTYYTGHNISNPAVGVSGSTVKNGIRFKGDLIGTADNKSSDVILNLGMSKRLYLDDSPAFMEAGLSFGNHIGKRNGQTFFNMGPLVEGGLGFEKRTKCGVNVGADMHMGYGLDAPMITDGEAKPTFTARLGALLGFKKVDVKAEAGYHPQLGNFKSIGARYRF